MTEKENITDNTTELADIIVDAASDKKALEVVLIDIRENAHFADYFVICTASNTRQISAIARGITDKLDEVGVNVIHREGDSECGWVLLDIGDIIVHIFDTEKREYYKLEKLWANAPTAVYVQ